MSPPKWKMKHTVRGVNKSPGRSTSQRSALRTLHPNERNSRLLVGRGSPRIATVGKGKVCLLSRKVINLCRHSISKYDYRYIYDNNYF